eukprot:3236329-Rhodomonas_salina.2
MRNKKHLECSRLVQVDARGSCFYWLKNFNVFENGTTVSTLAPTVAIAARCHCQCQCPGTERIASSHGTKR